MKVFISYAFTDKELARRIAAGLRASGFHVWDDSLVYPGDWHGQQKGNVCLADGHVVFTTRPPVTGGEYSWF